MAKKKPNLQKVPKEPAEKKPVVSTVEEKLKEDSRLKNSILTLINFMFLILAHVAYIDQKKTFTTEQLLAKVPAWLVIMMLLAAPFICYGYYFVTKTSDEDWKKPEIMLRNNKLNAILTASVFTIIFIPKFYHFGYPDMIAEFFVTKIPTIGLSMAQGLSGFFAFITTGGIGIITAISINLLSNFIYDKWKAKKQEISQKKAKKK